VSTAILGFPSATTEPQEKWAPVGWSKGKLKRTLCFSEPCRKVLYPELSVILLSNSRQVLRLVAVITSFQSVLIYYLSFRLSSMLQDKLAAA